MIYTQKSYVYNETKTSYVIYSDGRVYSEISNKFLKPWKSKHGYMNIHLFIDGNKIRKGIHQLVAEAFIPNPENKPEVNHIDGNKQNNDVSNLEWCTKSENRCHAYDTGLHKAISGKDVHFAVYTEDQIMKACQLIEENKKSLSEIESLTGVPAKTLSEIRSGKIWKQIAKNFKFPKEKIIASRIGLDYEMNMKFKELSRSGMSIDEICERLHLQKTRQLSKANNFYRNHKKKKHKKKNKKMKKVQRSSNTYFLNGHEIEETFMFSGE